MTYLADLSAFAYTIGATWLASYLWLRRFRLLTGQPQLDAALCGGVGLGVLSYVTALLSALHLLWLPAWLPVAGVLLLSMCANRPLLRLPDLHLRLPSWSKWCWMLIGLALLHIGLNLIAALAPATGVDSLLYHLAVPAIYLRKGGMIYLPSIYPSNWPFTIQMIFLYALWLRGDAVAQLLNCWAVILTLLGSYGLVRRWSNAQAALLASALYLSISDVILQSSEALIDVGAALFLFLSFAALVIWQERQENRWLVLAGMLAGWFAASRISNAGLVIALAFALGLFVLYRNRLQRWRASVRAVLIFGTSAFLIASPWYLRSWAYTGNPVYPYLYNLFGGRNFSAEAAAYHTQISLYKTLGPRSLIGLLKMPWVLTINPKQYRSGTLGPIVLACLPLLVKYWRNLPPWKGLATTFVILSIPIWYLTYTRLRSLLPVVIVLIMLLVIAIDSLLIDQKALPMLKRSVILSLSLWLLVGLSNNWRVHGDAVLTIVGIRDRDSFVDAELRSTGFDWYRDYQYLNQILPEDANVLIWDERGYYLKRDYTWVGGLTRGMATPEQLADPSKLLALLRSLGITHAVWHASRDFSEQRAKLRETLLATGCTTPIYRSETIVVVRIEHECAASMP